MSVSRLVSGNSSVNVRQNFVGVVQTFFSFERMIAG